MHALLPPVEELHDADRLPHEAELDAIATEHSGRPVTTAQLVEAETIGESQPAMKALALMLASNYRRLIVVGAGGEMAGIVTQRDLTRTGLLNLHMSTRGRDACGKPRIRIGRARTSSGGDGPDRGEVQRGRSDGARVPYLVI